MNQIELDAPRSFSGKHSMVLGLMVEEGSVARPELVQWNQQLLLAYMLRVRTRRLAVDYTQGMSFLAALLLLVVGQQEAAYWLFCHLIERVRCCVLLCAAVRCCCCALPVRCLWRLIGLSAGAAD